MIPLMEVSSFLTGKRAVSLPFTDYCEPLAPHHEVLKVMFDAIILEGKKEDGSILSCVEVSILWATVKLPPSTIATPST